MSKPTIKLKAPVDPVDASNRALLADRKRRIEANRKVLPDLGLDLHEPKEATNATEFMDEFDKKAFGYGEQATITKIIYGPDPLVDNSPAFRDALDRYGRIDLARHYAESILLKGSACMPDPLMQKSLELGIARFGAEAVAAAFHDRVMKIPMRTVEIDASDTLDPEVMGGAVLAETVRRYERPGMAYRFFTKACLDRFGWRGYTAVKDKGDIVCAGTLMLGEIPRHQVELRRRRLAEIARDKLAGVADSLLASQEDIIRNASAEGVNVAGVSGLDLGERVTARAGVGGEDPEGYLNQERASGFRVERETA